MQQPSSTELTPFVRLRASKQSSTTAPAGPPFVFAFLGPGTTLPLPLMPHVSSQASSHSISSSPSSAHSHASSTAQHHDVAPTNHQDVLVFEPQDGSLSLRRVTVSRRAPREDFGTTIRVPSTSISLPGVSTLRTFAGNAQARQPSALSKMMEKTELAGQDVVVATWALRRSVDWNEVKKVFPLGPGRRSSTARPHAAEYVFCSFTRSSLTYMHSAVRGSRTRSSRRARVPASLCPSPSISPTSSHFTTLVKTITLFFAATISTCPRRRSTFAVKFPSVRRQRALA